MTDINHRRSNRAPVNQRHAQHEYQNGYAAPDNKTREKPAARVGRTDFLDKSLHGRGQRSDLADKYIAASIGNDFTDGHRGMARAVRGAKKFVRTRLRASENAATVKLAKDAQVREVDSPDDNK